MTIYFIRAVDCGRIKIGYTEHPSPLGRLSSMQVGCPSKLEVVAHCEGSEARESELHALFKRTNVRGEWFTMSHKLASLLAYVEKTKSTYGWEAAEQAPAEFARFFVKHKMVRRPEWVGVDESDVEWALALERLEAISPRRIPSNLASLTDHFWDHGEHSQHNDSVEHTVQSVSYVDTQFGWLSNRGRLQGTSAEELTVRLLANAKNKDVEGAVWLGACIHTLTNDRHGNIYSAREKIPGLDAVEFATRDLLSEFWNSRSARPLPLHFALPERCRLTIQEFCLAVAHHRQLTLQRFTPYVAWRHGAHNELPAQQEVAA